MVLSDTGTAEAESGGLVPSQRIVIGGGNPDHGFCSRRDRHVADPCITAGKPLDRLDRALQSQDLLQECRDQCGIAAQLVLQSRLTDQIAHGITDQIGAGVLPRVEQKGR
ncbi:MAG: hypothetical protein P8J20_15800 [Novosphingobium sp.]|nr:hypothetical protein [Novosphingobium sp.]